MKLYIGIVLFISNFLIYQTLLLFLIHFHQNSQPNSSNDFCNFYIQKQDGIDLLNSSNC